MMLIAMGIALAPMMVLAGSREPDGTLVLSGTVCARATGTPVAGAQVGAQGH
jgi:hypothetical protein